MAKSCLKWRQVVEQAFAVIASIDVLDEPVPDITFAEIDVSVGHPARLRWAERFGVKDGRELSCLCARAVRWQRDFRTM